MSPKRQWSQGCYITKTSVKSTNHSHKNQKLLIHRVHTLEKLPETHTEVDGAAVLANITPVVSKPCCWTPEQSMPGLCICLSAHWFSCKTSKLSYIGLDWLSSTLAHNSNRLGLCSRLKKWWKHKSFHFKKFIRLGEISPLGAKRRDWTWGMM